MTRSPRTLALATALLAATALAPSSGLQPVSAQAVEDLLYGGGAPGTALLEGRYDEALAAFERLDRNGAPSAVTRAHARVLMEVGRWDEALAATGPADPGAPAADPDLANVRGEILAATGRLDEAEAAFRRSWEARAPDRHVARKNLGVLLWRRGERDRALEIFDGFIDLYNEAAPGTLSAEELLAVGTAVRYLGTRQPSLYRDALMAYDDAAERAPGDPRPDLLAGELFLGAYNGTDAGASFQEVLARNPRQPDALVGRARVLDFSSQPGAMESARAALEVNPGHVGARTLVARLLLRTEGYGEAVREAERALDVDPKSLEALSVLAAAHWLAGDSAAFGRARDRALAVNPRYPDLYATIAELAADQRRYMAAVELGRRAVALDSTSWRSWGVLAMNQLRTGSIPEGRSNLERAFEGDPYNVWYKNTLDLLDTFERYETVRTEHFELFVHGEEADLIGPYASRVAEEAFAALKARYGAEPPTPVRIEMFPSHADFSVRTLGLVGLGALGVSFGSTLVMDSPSAREAGEFNWESTLWHELAHAFHLALSDHRVPRWFSEGLSVREQRVADPRWGHRVSPAWLQAWRAGRLHPVSRLDEGFVRPAFPEQIVFSYFQASLVFDLIEERWGFDAIRRMLDGYRDGRGTAGLVRSVLGMEPGAFDETFQAYVDERFGDRMAAIEPLTDLPDPAAASLEDLRRQATRHPGSFQARHALGKALFQAGRADEALEEMRAALRLFPEHGGADGPYAWLARIHRERGETELAANALHQLGRHNESVYQAHVDEAELRLQLGDLRAATAALRRAVEVFPYDVELHQRLAELHTRSGDHEEAVFERRAVLSLDPVDRADAHYRLAAALADAGRRDDARSEVLRALEIAPNFEEALDLLLELRGGTG